MNKFRDSFVFKLFLYIVMVVMLVYLVVFMPTPYIIYQPGSAEEVQPMINVKDGDTTEQGTFMMTTVSARYANIALLAVASFNSNAEIDKKESRLGEKSEAEYAAEQVFYMSNSQSSAMEAAYKEAKVAYKILPEYLFVFSVPKEADNSKYFNPGDRITEVDGEPISDNVALTTLLTNKKVGDIVSIKLNRGGESLVENVPLVSIKDGSETRPGLGIIIATMQKVTTDDPGKQVEFVNTQVGGPSAGLMFTMEIYNQLTEGDLTQGYRVAGTGTIVEDGTVGPIGGVKHKIVAADRQNAEIFFVPKDNYEEAKARADKIHTTMKLIPVSTVEDALSYMNNLEARP
ncbi:PDZ domain-containing protein [Paenibacillus sp. DS2015]|uniref:SepM family pheromone-processing serine protease n=1 Tax=Paenibacillus sp. DS2015 TaxID=3373917 RepID=UPI003D1BEBDF